MVMKQTLKTVALAIGCAIAAAQAHAEPVQLTPQDKTFTQRVPGSGGVYLRFGQAGAKRASGRCYRHHPLSHRSSGRLAQQAKKQGVKRDERSLYLAVGGSHSLN
jgi:hypothetical protein